MFLVRTNSAYSVCVRAGGKLLTSGSSKTLLRGDVRESCVRPKAPLSEGAPAGCDGARGVAPAEALLSAFRRPVAEPSLRAVLVLPVTVRAVRGADISVAWGCFLALGVVPVALGGCKAASRRYFWLPESPTRLGAESCRHMRGGLAKMACGASGRPREGSPLIPGLIWRFCSPSGFCLCHWQLQPSCAHLPLSVEIVYEK